VTCNLVLESPADCSVRVQGTKGELIVPRPAPRPQKYIIRLDTGEEIVKEFPIPGNGYHWEADAVARCLRDGLKECARMSISDSILSMEVSLYYDAFCSSDYELTNVNLSIAAV
jgi:dihydrodiol dehydrogenase / D-xylose 1-dehydrogenase (NADP)